MKTQFSTKDTEVHSRASLTPKSLIT